MKIQKCAALFIAGMLCSILLYSQNVLHAIIRDSSNQQILTGVSCSLKGQKAAAVSDRNGLLILKNIPDGSQTISFSNVSFKPVELILSFPLSSDSPIVVLMVPEQKELEQVTIVASSRTNSRLENLPTRVEVIGEEEMIEENGIKPGNIASILGDIAGIQFQQTSATTGNADMRIQGLQGKYTQILRDGLPLFGGYSGSFGILQIPPLDLRQVEIIKGASSTLFGGGAIAGMINLISKRPVAGQRERSITLNQSTLLESNFNLYLADRKNKTGYTFFTGVNYQRAVDVNNDGFSDVPDLKSFFIHPRLFFYPNSANTIILGYTTNYEDRNGGDMQVLHQAKDSQHEFYIQNKTFRNTIDVDWQRRFGENDFLTTKATVSLFNRNISTPHFGMKAQQVSYYTEFAYTHRSKNNDLVIGLNFTGEDFHKKLPDSTLIENYSYITSGVFIQDTWKPFDKLTIQPGLRYDYHNVYGSFVLPSLSFLYKISKTLTSRLGGGAGYKTPTTFSSEIDERDYPILQPLGNVKSEQSWGASWDINFRKSFGDWELTLNQSFFITTISDPIITSTSPTEIRFSNASDALRTQGFDTYIQASHNKLELYFGYVHTEAKKLYDPQFPNLSLSARDKFATVIAYEFSDHWRAGIEAAYTGMQYLDDGTTTPSYLFAAGMIRYTRGIFTVVLNGENLLDYRQTKQEDIVIPPQTDPRFKQLWAPIDGRVINLSLLIRW